MADKLYGTGEIASMLGLKLRDVDYAIQRGKAGAVQHVAGRRALTAANCRDLARHFGKVCPAECRNTPGGELFDIEQQSTEGKK